MLAWGPRRRAAPLPSCPAMFAPGLPGRTLSASDYLGRRRRGSRPPVGGPAPGVEPRAGDAVQMWQLSCSTRRACPTSRSGTRTSWVGGLREPQRRASPFTARLRPAVLVVAGGDGGHQALPRGVRHVPADRGARLRFAGRCWPAWSSASASGRSLGLVDDDERLGAPALGHARRELASGDRAAALRGALGALAAVPRGHRRRASHGGARRSLLDGRVLALAPGDRPVFACSPSAAGSSPGRRSR